MLMTFPVKMYCKLYVFVLQNPWESSFSFLLFKLLPGLFQTILTADKVLSYFFTYKYLLKLETLKVCTDYLLQSNDFREKILEVLFANAFAIHIGYRTYKIFIFRYKNLKSVKMIFVGGLFIVWCIMRHQRESLPYLHPIRSSINVKCSKAITTFFHYQTKHGLSNI